MLTPEQRAELLAKTALAVENSKRMAEDSHRLTVSARQALQEILETRLRVEAFRKRIVGK